MFFKKSFSYGLEVTDHEFRWVGLNLKDLSYYCWSCSLFAERDSKDHQQEPDSYQRALAAAIERCKGSTPKWSKSVRSSPNTGCLGGYLELPLLKDKELEVAVPGMICRKVPWNLEAVHLIMQKVKPLNEKQDVLGICYLALEKKGISERNQFLKLLGFNPTTDDLLPLALIREFESNHESQEGCVGLLHVCDSQTHVTFMKSGHPYFYRSFHPGYSDFVYAVQMDRQSSWKEAASELVEIDLSLMSEPGLEPILLRWLREIRRCVKSVTSLGLNEPLKPVSFYLSGQTPLGIERRLQNETGVSSHLDGADNIKPIDPKVEGLNPNFKLALGLALGGR